MKKITILTVMMVFLSPVIILAQRANQPAPANQQKQAAAPEKKEAAPQVIGEILSPFYVRKAERYTDGQIHYVNSDASFEIMSKDMGGTGLNRVEYAIDNGPFQIYTSPFKLEKEGNRLILFRGIDNSGNVEKSVLYQVYVDNTPPHVWVGTDRGLYKSGMYYYCSNKMKFYIAAQDDPSGSGVRQTFAGTGIDKMSARGTGISAAANFFNVTDVEGPYEFYYTAIDNVGNMADITKYNIIVDNTPPLVDIDRGSWISMTSEGMRSDENTHISKDTFIIVPNRQGGANSYFVNGNYQVGFTAVDPKIGMLDGSGVAAIYAKVNDEEFRSYKGPIKFERNKTYKITVKAEDNVGNISKDITYFFSLDFDRPESKINVINSKGQTVEEKTGPPAGQ
jgi:hypothetical protein